MAPRRKIRAKKPRKPPLNATAYTIKEFCEAHRISRAMFYVLQRAGLGPKVMDAGRKIITTEAAAEWRRKGTNAAAQQQQG